MFVKFVYKKKSNNFFSGLPISVNNKTIENIQNFLQLKHWFYIQNIENITRLFYVAVQTFLKYDFEMNRRTNGKQKINYRQTFQATDR